ncbi:unnamed protein product [Prunus armeniaca]
MKSFENEEGRGKGKSKVTGTSRRNEKGKKDKHGEVQRGGWSFKGFTYALQICVYELIPRMADLNYCKVVDPTAVPQQRGLSVQLRALRPSEEKMRQPYWSWPQDRLAVVSVGSIPSSYADLDELNKVVSLLRSELFQVKREKDVLELKVIRMEKLLDHCLGPQFEQEVRRDLALLKEMTNRCAISHLFKGSEQMDDIQCDEGPSNRNEGEEKEEEGIEGGEEPSNRNEGKEKEEEGVEGVEVQRKPSEVEESQRKRSEGEQVKIKSSKGEEAQRKSSDGEEVKRKSSDILNVVNGKYHIHTFFTDNKRKKEQCEIKVYDSIVSLIPYEILKEELASLSITIPNLLNTIDFYEEGVYANDCSRDWWCPWSIERVNVPQQSNQGDCGMFVLKYIELLSSEIPLDTCTLQNMPFFRLKLAAEILRGEVYMT